jgi:hypothetical protein
MMKYSVLDRYQIAKCVVSYLLVVIGDPYFHPLADFTASVI